MPFLFSSAKSSTELPIGIAFLDTGISPMSDFIKPTNRIVVFSDFIHGQKSPYDDNGHGTHVAGIASGNGFLSHGKYCGIAPETNIISLKILDREGQGSSAHAIHAMSWILAHAKQYNIKVVNLSIGSNDKKINIPLKESVEKLWEQGIVVVAAAANPDGRGNKIHHVPLSKKIITVGAWEDRSFFHLPNQPLTENRPTVFASGENIISLMSPQYRFGLSGRKRSNVVGRNYISMSGASMATPFVSGMVARILKEHPEATPIEIVKEVVSVAERNHGVFK
ncbi:MAG: S8 family serine peptidase [Bacillota bacterium]